MILRGLTLWRPWAASIVHGPKRVENRPWTPSLRLLDQGLWIALHAGTTWNQPDAAFIAERWPEARAAVAAPDGSLDGWCRVEDRWPRQWTAKGVVGVARVVRVVRAAWDPRHESKPRFSIEPEDLGPWAFGPWCWVLDDVRALPEPIPCSGRQMLWTLPPDVEERLRPWCERKGA